MHWTHGQRCYREGHYEMHSGWKWPLQPCSRIDQQKCVQVRLSVPSDEKWGYVDERCTKKTSSNYCYRWPTLVLRAALCLSPWLRFMGRMRICKLVLGTESPSGTNTLADELEFLSSSFVCFVCSLCRTATIKFKPARPITLRSSGIFSSEAAASIVPVQTLLDTKTFLLKGETKEEIDERVKLVREVIKSYKVMGTAMKRGCTDMASALNCVKTSENLRKDSKTTTRERRKALKLPPNCSTSDPSCLKICKVLEKPGFKYSEGMLKCSFPKTKDDVGILLLLVSICQWTQEAW